MTTKNLSLFGSVEPQQRQQQQRRCSKNVYRSEQKRKLPFSSGSLFGIAFIHICSLLWLEGESFFPGVKWVFNVLENLEQTQTYLCP